MIENWGEKKCSVRALRHRVAGAIVLKATDRCHKANLIEKIQRIGEKVD